MNRKQTRGKIDAARIEERTDLLLDFDKLKKVATAGMPVVPVAVQDVKSNDVLLIAYVNEEALRYTLEHKIAAFWSTSRNELWVKGLTSGDKLEIVEVLVNCEQNSLVYRVKLLGKGSCHTKDKSGTSRHGCYYRRLQGDKLEFI